MSQYTFGPDVQFDPAFLDNLFKETFGYKTDGTFVEVGAYDGKTYSHTWGLAEIGWKGVYIEPHPDIAKKCRENHAGHPNVVVKEMAAGGRYGAGKLFIDEFSCCGSTINPAVCKNPVERLVGLAPLDGIMSEECVLPGFDLLSIDVEFGEMDVLRGFTLERWFPKIVIIELCEKHPEPKHSMAAPARELCEEMFPKAGYEKRWADWLNTIYVKP